ncbi:hypothetical protein JW979_01135 [bacterium]|nr:hypothetical protein [candidate division CSSED10-310 bacterium]
MRKTKAFEIFFAAVNAITQGVLIKRISSSDKEFHFQNWFESRLTETGILFDKSGWKGTYFRRLSYEIR